jgi:hypothetical protein
MAKAHKKYADEHGQQRQTHERVWGDGSLEFRLGLVGIFLSATALALDIAIAVLGWQSVTLLGQ